MFQAPKGMGIIMIRIQNRHTVATAAPTAASTTARAATIIQLPLLKLPLLLRLRRRLLLPPLPPGACKADPCDMVKTRVSPQPELDFAVIAGACVAGFSVVDG